VALADAASPVRFLALFGRIGACQPAWRMSADNKQVPAQWLQLLNSSHIQKKNRARPQAQSAVRFDNNSRPPSWKSLSDDSLASANGDELENPEKRRRSSAR